MAGGDPGIFDRCHSEYSSLVQVRILPEEKPIGHDGADQRGCDKEAEAFFMFQGFDDSKNRSNVAALF